MNSTAKTMAENKANLKGGSAKKTKKKDDINRRWIPKNVCMR
jgi:hypothetical protein